MEISEKALVDFFVPMNQFLSPTSKATLPSAVEIRRYFIELY